MLFPRRGYVLGGFVLRGFSPTTDEDGVSDLGGFDRGLWAEYKIIGWRHSEIFAK